MYECIHALFKGKISTEDSNVKVEITKQERAMNEILLAGLIIMISGCVSIPQQAVTSQELVLKGVESAYGNQVTLINAYADDQISNTKKLLENVVLEKVIIKQLNGRKALPPEEVKELITMYSKDLSAEIKKVETKRKQLLKIAEEGYGEIISLTKTNLEFIKTASNANERQQKLLEQYKEKLDKVKAEINEYIK